MKTTRFISCGMWPHQGFCLWTLSFISCSPALTSDKASTITTVLVVMCCCTADPMSQFLSSHVKFCIQDGMTQQVFSHLNQSVFVKCSGRKKAGNRKSASRLRVRAQYQLCTFFFCGFTPGSVQPKQQEPAASCLISAMSTPLLCNLLCNLPAFP